MTVMHVFFHDFFSLAYFSYITDSICLLLIIVTGIASVDAVHLTTSETADEFKLGDCVFVSGVKKGVIAFIGETQFAPGVWAGILLDEPIGKNDGSVNGVRYFACQPLRGIFAKLNTLTSRPADASSGSDKAPLVAAHVSKSSDTYTVSSVIGSSSSQSLQDGQSDVREHIPANSANTAPAAAANVSRLSKLPATSSRPSGLVRLSRSTGTASSASSSLSQPAAAANQSLSEATPAAHYATNGSKPASSVHALKVGDRVLVGGNKAGMLRFFGTTHFAKGEWAGIELDEPVGKNDGSVEGKRYGAYCSKIVVFFVQLVVLYFHCYLQSLRLAPC